MNPADPRAQRTRVKLDDSLITLALEKGYGNFTVRHLTKHASVGYATFFRHFKSMDELLTQIFLGTFQDLMRCISQRDTIFDEAVAMYRFVSQHPDIFRVYYSLAPDHPVRAAFDEASKQHICHMASQGHFSAVPLALALDYLMECSQLLITWYLDHLAQYTPEDMASMHFDLIIKGQHHELTLNSDT